MMESIFYIVFTLRYISLLLKDSIILVLFVQLNFYSRILIQALIGNSIIPFEFPAPKILVFFGQFQIKDEPGRLVCIPLKMIA